MCKVQTGVILVLITEYQYAIQKMLKHWRMNGRRVKQLDQVNSANLLFELWSINIVAMDIMI